MDDASTPTPHAPQRRLADMHALVPDAAADADAPQGLGALRARGPRVTPPASLADRPGYDAAFLGRFHIAWPHPTGSQREDVLPIAPAPQVAHADRLDYTHFSVTMSRSRRMAMFVGVNISGADAVDIGRDKDVWAYDGRIPLEAQIGEDLYADNLLDRGHLVRRQDPNWGGRAREANDDTFHFTNCSPQMASFNQKTWLGLEDFILGNVQAWKARVTVFTGPVFRPEDRVYRGVALPAAYWKVVAFLSDTGTRSATAYLIDQTRELDALEITFGRYKTYQVSVHRIETMTGLSFGALSRHDGYSGEEKATGRTVETEVRTAADIRW